MPCTHPTRLVLDRLGNPDRLRVVIKEDEVMVTRPDYAIDAAGVRKPRPWLPPSLSENPPRCRPYSQHELADGQAQSHSDRICNQHGQHQDYYGSGVSKSVQRADCFYMQQERPPYEEQSYGVLDNTIT